jgi:KaiC/GvpD/RAD55 family RecA-like ATPase
MSRTQTINAWPPVLDRLPPNSIEAEEAVLGSILIDPTALERCRRILAPIDFYIVKNQRVFEAMLSLVGRQAPIDFVTLTRELEARGQLDELGGPAYISHLVNAVPTAIHAEGYAKIVKRAAVRRVMLHIHSEAAQRAYDETTDEIQVIQETVDRLRGLKAAALAHLSDEDITMSAREILQTNWPEPVWIVPQYMVAGMTFVSGKQKVGKSWLIMQIACAKGTGGRVFNQKVSQGRVLYLALEDSPRRLKSRMIKQAWPLDAAVDFVYFKRFQEEIGDLSQGGAERLIYMAEAGNYELIVIDTFSKAIGMYLKSGDQNDASTITKALANLHDYANSRNKGLVFVDHFSKAVGNEGGDPLNDMIGWVAKGGVTDTAWGLYRERGKLGAVLNIVGRDIDGDQSLMLTFDKDLGCWHYDGDGALITLTNRRQEILDVVKKHKRCSPQTIADETGQAKSHVSSRCADLVNSGLLLRIEEGRNVWYELKAEE